MSDGKEEKQLVNQESASETGVKPPEVEKEKVETLESVIEEQKEGVKKGVEIVEARGNKDTEVLEIQGASPKEKKEFTDGEEKIKEEAEEAKEEYENSFKTEIEIKNQDNVTKKPEKAKEKQGIAEQIRSVEKRAELINAQKTSYRQKLKLIDELSFALGEIAKNCDDASFKNNRSEFSRTGDMIGETRSAVEEGLIEDFKNRFEDAKKKALAIKPLDKSLSEKIEHIETFINLLHMEKTDSENADFFNRHQFLKEETKSTIDFLQNIINELKNNFNKN